MKKVTLILATLLVLSGTAAFAATIDGSKHDLASDQSGWYNEICVYCHTPHGGSPAVPLWNRSNPDIDGTFSVYTSATLNATASATMAGTVSGMCLSCHDGSTGIADALVNAPNTGAVGGSVSTATMSTLFSGSVAILGQDLRNDHPVNIDYISGGSTDINVTVGTFAKIFDGKVQCASCHDPHDNANVPFLIAVNTNSQICTSCHAK